MNIQPFFLMLGLLAAQYVFGRYPSMVTLLARPMGLVAMTVGLLGVILMAGAATVLLWHRTTIHPGRTPEKLVTKGLFAYSRNPIYLGMVCVLITIPLMATQPRLFIFTLIYCLVMNYYVIPREERIIRAKFTTDFDQYTQSTHRWLGRTRDQNATKLF